MAAKRYTTGQIESALRASGGRMAEAAYALGVPRSTVWRRVQASPELQQAMIDADEELVDMAIGVFRRRIEADDLTAAMYVANNSPAAKRRGWGPRQEVTGADGSEVVLRVIHERKRIPDPTA